MATQEKKSAKVLLVCKGKACLTKLHPHPAADVMCHCPNCQVIVPHNIRAEYVRAVERLMDALRTGESYRDQLEAANRICDSVECPFAIQVL